MIAAAQAAKEPNMPTLAAMFKTVSTDCNLDCGYCYYRQSLLGKPIHQIDSSMLEAFTCQYMEYVADTRQANIGWQGGEPTLAGLDFFRRVVELETRYARPGTAINNMIQTNGTLLNNEWGHFLKEFNFLVGISLDGPESVHDMQRKDRGGHGSFRRVMSGIEVLRHHRVDMNILCVVGPHNVTQALQIMRFYQQEGLTHLQFMPAMGFQATEPEEQPVYSVSPEAYGQFLIALFDQWYEGSTPRVSIRIFDNFLQSYLGIQNELCVHSDACNAGVVVEYNGDVYPCDFYIHPRWKLGSIFQESLIDIAENPQRTAFIKRKHPLPTQCKTCTWKDLCKGGCPRNRPTLPNGGQAPEYFCQSYKQLLVHAHSRLQSLSQRIANRQRYLQQIDIFSMEHRPKPGRNDPCPCGSGRKHKACCGDPAISSSYLFQLEA